MLSGLLLGGCCGSLRGKGWAGGSIYQTFIKREKLELRCLGISGIVLLSVVL